MEAESPGTVGVLGGGHNGVWAWVLMGAGRTSWRTQLRAPGSGSMLISIESRVGLRGSLDEPRALLHRATQGPRSPSPAVLPFPQPRLALHLFIYLFYLFVFLAALGLRCCVRAFSSCGKRGLLFVAVHGLLIAVASLVAEHGL